MIELDLVRSDCTASLIPVGGVMAPPTLGHGCVCNYSVKNRGRGSFTEFYIPKRPPAHERFETRGIPTNRVHYLRKMRIGNVVLIKTVVPGF